MHIYIFIFIKIQLWLQIRYCLSVGIIFFLGIDRYNFKHIAWQKNRPYLGNKSDSEIVRTRVGWHGRNEKSVLSSFYKKRCVKQMKRD